MHRNLLVLFSGSMHNEPRLRSRKRRILLKKFFKRHMPDSHAVMSNRWVARLGPRIREPNLWHFNRRSVSVGVFAGVFAAFMPPGLQLFIALPLALFLRGNIAVAFGSTWITNPVTYAPIYFACYKLGLWMMGENPDISSKHFNLETMASDLMHVGQPLLLGCLVSAIVFSCLAFVVVRLLWRLHILNHIKVRAARRKAKKQADSD